MGKKIPDGWLDYKPFKDVISDINIVPLKVPLPARQFNDDVMKIHKWTPFDVMDHFPRLGLVIDLTFKFPSYYNSAEFGEKGVEYIKIGCKGHDKPPEETFQKFCETVDAFLQKHPNRIIGVHCTHGINRTGYMICRYMVEKRGYTAKDALETFATKRGYAVERDNYIQDVHNSAKVQYLPTSVAHQMNHKESKFSFRH